MKYQCSIAQFRITCEILQVGFWPHLYRSNEDFGLQTMPNMRTPHVDARDLEECFPSTWERKVCRLGKVEWDLPKSGIAESRARLNYQTGKRRCRAVTLISNKNGAKRPSDRRHTVTRWSHASSRVLHLPLGSTFYICVWFPAQLLLLSTNLFSISVKIKAQSVSIVTPETESAPIPLEERYLFNKETWVRRK